MKISTQSKKRLIGEDSNTQGEYLEVEHWIREGEDLLVLVMQRYMRCVEIFPFSYDGGR